jgi:hypothetical protein
LAVQASADDAFRESITRLHSAQKAVAEGRKAEAKAAFSAIRDGQNVPAHHRREAEECLHEIERIEKGLPARDPAATRTVLPTRPKAAISFHLAPNGNDSAPGTKEKPFRSLERARDAVRAWKQTQPSASFGSAEIVLGGGEYAVTKTFELNAQDSGTQSSPIVYRAGEGQRPIFRGGIRVDGFRPVSDPDVLARLPKESQGKVLCADLKTLGVKNLPPFALGGFASGRGFTTHPTQELFFNGKPMTLARWPNQGFATLRDIVMHDGQPSHGLVGSKTGLFQYEGDRPSRWRKESDAWLYGYWFWGWADSYERIASIDPQKHEIALTPPFSTYGYRKGQPYYALNLLAEIDMPGEWYLDRTSALLYFWPPSNLDPGTVELSLNAFPFLNMQKTSHVIWEGVTWELGGTDAIIVDNADHCLLAGCTVRRCAGNGVEIRGGENNGVLSCDIHSLGRGGVTISGGNRKTLAPAANFVENCDVSDLSRIDHTYTPAIALSGVGNRIIHNRLHHIPSSALNIGGNDHVVEFNDVFNVVLESDDQGGADMFGNPTFRGNVFRYNSWRCIGNWRHPNEGPGCGQAGIRLDDAISGVLIYGNIFFRASAGKLGFGGVQIHGGKDNILDNNLFVDCESAVSQSAWDDARWREFTKNSLAAPEIDRSLFVTKYPPLAELAEHANHNTIARSLVVQCRQFLRRGSDRLDLIENWETPADPGFRNAAQGDFQLEDVLPATTKIGWRPIPTSEIGLYLDAFRKNLPTSARPSSIANPR